MEFPGHCTGVDVTGYKTLKTIRSLVPVVFRKCLVIVDATDEVVNVCVVFFFYCANFTVNMLVA